MINYKTFIPGHSKFTICACMVIFLSLLITCKSEQKEPVPDVSAIKVNPELVRFEQKFFNLDTNKLDEGIRSLQSEYPSFFKLYLEQILSLTENVDSMNLDSKNAIKQFITDSATYALNKVVQTVYPSNDFLNKELTQSLRYMKYYFPEENDPVFYTLISEFGYANFIFEESAKRDGIGIGLDFFLGDHYDYSRIDPKNPAFSNYLNRCFNKDHLLKKTWETWIEDRIGNPENGRLIDYMILRGKKLYTLSKFLPEVNDTVLFEYSPEQLTWCNQNRIEMWSFFLEKNLLYSTELIKFNKYVNPSPHSPGMPEQAPGQTGSYMGYHIVRSYMKRHPQTSLIDLWKNQDSQAFLNEAKFKPRNE
jgi:hypothetical protein